MKRLIYISILCLITSMQAHAQSFLLSFYGSYDASGVSTVKITNLSSGASAEITGLDTLRLNVVTAARNLSLSNQNTLIYPNPADDACNVEFTALKSGKALISISDVSGKCIASSEIYLSKATHRFELTGLPAGVFHVRISSEHQLWSSTLVATGSKQACPEIAYRGQTESAGDDLEIHTKSLQDMDYVYGDIVLLEAVSDLGHKAVSTKVFYAEDAVYDVNFVYVYFYFLNCTDYNNYAYRVVSINDQYWIAENLLTTAFSDGTAIPVLGETNLWNSTSNAAYCDFNNTASNSETAGRLYNWYAVNDSRKICPEGWHVPFEEEWIALEQYLGIDTTELNALGWRGTDQGCKLKETGNVWLNPSGDENNLTGFSARPAGIRGLTGDFYFFDSYATWWTASESTPAHAWIRALKNDDCKIFREDGSKTMGFSVRCVKTFLPEVYTSYISDMSGTTAVSGGYIYWQGSNSIVARGVVWGQTQDLSLESCMGYTDDGTGLGEYESTITGLQPGTTYFVSAYASNRSGTAYGYPIEFTTPEEGEVFCPEFIYDIEGNEYYIVKIGNQCWFAENLKTTMFRDSTPISNLSGDTEWSEAALMGDVPGYCYYNNDYMSFGSSYGALYNWFAVSSSKGLCPEGWHVPSDNEWFELETYVDASITDINATNYRGTDGGTKLKSSWGWSGPVPGTDEYGFSALPGGQRYHEGFLFEFVSELGGWWTSTQHDEDYARLRILNSEQTGIFRGNYSKTGGFSVRCVKN